jgi:hypothetical protein
MDWISFKKALYGVSVQVQRSTSGGTLDTEASIVQNQLKEG